MSRLAKKKTRDQDISIIFRSVISLIATNNKTDKGYI